jgi:RNA polymerase sigma factor (sigma-70 family)
MLQPTPLKSKSEINSGVPSTKDGITLRSLFENEESNLLRFAFSLTGRRAVAEEIVQDVFLQLHANWKDVESPRAWLYQCVRHAAWNHLRKAKREVLHSDDEQAIQCIEDKDQLPDVVLQNMETTKNLNRLLEKLPEMDQQLVRLKYFEGLKYREISERTGLTVSNVGFRLHTIMQTLAKGLQPMERSELK